MSDLFEPRDNIKPLEYPECEKFVEAIRQSYWVHTEFNFTTDIQQYHTELDDYQRDVIKKCLLLISQVEVGVKTFWCNLHRHIPKPEVLGVGATFGESEKRHLDAYSKLLEILGLNEEFEKISEIPAVMDRHIYLKKYKEFATARLEENFLKAIILFSLFIENVSLFSQFFIIQSFNKHRKWLVDINNVVAATSKEEAIHGLFGIWLINQIKEEHPDFFNDELKKLIYTYSHKAYDAEEKLLNWIFPDGDLVFEPTVEGCKPDYIKVSEVKDFIKSRLNDSLTGIGLDAIFKPNEENLKRTMWFDEKLIAGVHVDFFNQRPTNYIRKNKAISENDLF